MRTEDKAQKEQQQRPAGGETHRMRSVETKAPSAATRHIGTTHEALHKQTHVAMGGQQVAECPADRHAETSAPINDRPRDGYLKAALDEMDEKIASFGLKVDGVVKDVGGMKVAHTATSQELKNVVEKVTGVTHEVSEVKREQTIANEELRRILVELASVAKADETKTAVSTLSTKIQSSVQCPVTHPAAGESLKDAQSRREGPKRDQGCPRCSARVEGQLPGAQAAAPARARRGY